MSDVHIHHSNTCTYTTRIRRRSGRCPTCLFLTHALDVAAHRWLDVGDDLYVVGGRSGASTAGSVKAKTHKGVVVYSPLTGAWRKAAPMRAARSRPVLGVFEMSPGSSFSIC